MTRSLRLVLGDQLSRSLSSLEDIDPEADLVLMCEVAGEATHVRHHKKKIAFLFSAMRHFADELEQGGVPLRYVKLDAAGNSGSFSGELDRALESFPAERVIVTRPGEYRVLTELQDWATKSGVELCLREDTRFLSTPEEFSHWATGRKQLRMEYFYREMRRKHQVLMDGDAPQGGAWNYDSENRKPPEQGLDIPPPRQFAPDAVTREVLALAENQFANHFGTLKPFGFAVTRSEALEVLDHFIRYRLASFGDYQDAMIEGEPWMFHSHLSFYLNCGLLLPLECIRAAEAAYAAGQAPLNAVEGFIRQILGWREFVRGIYWHFMPDYAAENYLEADRPLPEFFWTGETKMNCLRQCICETSENAYAHHIQRLMVLGNFLLLAGVAPKEVNEWYLIVYADAYEWVEMPNVTGMILFADGGKMASKPYAASGSYINKMSDYCKNCSYKVSKKNGPAACPFNYLYWDFIARTESRLKGNPRLAMPYRTFARMDDGKKQAIRDDAERFFTALEAGEWI